MIPNSALQKQGGIFCKKMEFEMFVKVLKRYCGGATVVIK
jgi:hypothetical protein